MPKKKKSQRGKRLKSTTYQSEKKKTVKCCIPFCDNKGCSTRMTGLLCPECLNLTCAECVVGSASFCPRNERVDFNCPLCRTSLPIGDKDDFVVGNFCPLKPLLANSNKTMAIFKVGCCADHGSMELHIIHTPCSEGCASCSGSKINSIVVDMEYSSDEFSDDSF